MGKISQKQFNLTNRQKTAILLTSLPKDVTIQVMRELGASKEDLAFEMNRVSEVPKEVQQQVIDEFLRKSNVSDATEAEESITFTSPFTPGGEDSAYGVASKTKPLGKIRNIDPFQLANIIRKEHPQTIALILKYLQKEKAAMILSEFPTALQTEVSRRFAEMGKASPEVLEEIEKALEDSLYALMEGDYVQTDPQDALVEILSGADRQTEEEILTGLSEKSPAVAESIKIKLCEFEDILNIDEESLGQVLRLTDLRDLTVALKGASQIIADKVFSILSADVASALKEDIGGLGQISFEEVKSAQQQIRNILRGLVTLGKINFKK